MKKLSLFLLIIVISMTIYGQNVALHGSTGVKIFSGINAFKNAYDSSAVGDTIYLPGGSFNVPTTIDKKLSIFGAGHYSDSAAVTGKTFLLGNITLGENADNLLLEGVEITGTVSFATDKSIDNVTFKYCKFDNEIRIYGSLTNPTHNLAIINCVIMKPIILQNAQNAGIYNSICQEQIGNSIGNTVKNNVLMYNACFYSCATLVGDNNIIHNNIFISQYNNEISGNSNNIKNNIFIRSNPSVGTYPDSLNNYYSVSQSSIFINQTGYAFNYSHDYHLQYPSIYLGTDGTQVGIYGGMAPYPYKEGAVPSNPHFQYQNIGSASTIDGKLHIDIKAAAQDR